MSKEQLQIVLNGYEGKENPFLWGSNNWLLHEAGKGMAKAGYSKPVFGKKSRGFTVKMQTSANDFTAKFDDELKLIAIERHG